MSHFRPALTLNLTTADGFNHRWLLTPIGDMPSAEYEQQYYLAQEAPVMSAGVNEQALSRTPGRVKMVLCRLCQQDRPLQNSHIIPRFVSKWLLKSSPTRGLRDLHTPNRRREDTPTVPFLCSDCEGIFSPWESRFAAEIFLPLHLNQKNFFHYGSWGLKFAASVVWRVLTESLEHGPGRSTLEQSRVARVAEQTWRSFVLEKVRHPDRFEVHAIPLDVVSARHDAAVSPFLNRYLLRAAWAEVIIGKKEVLVYAKLCRILLVGHVIVEDQSRWRTSRLSVSHGTLDRDRGYYLPISLQEYMNQCAMRTANALASQSPHQKAKLNTRLDANPSRFATSEVFRALRVDVAQSGSEAFAVTGDLSDGATAANAKDTAEPQDT